ncbi:hypothetical protein ACFV8E_35805 [Streptomyces sp. NPDC059849]|uniref:hypothetical protein n=1 Tax=Streptomyces sp. NPDC059849 TaxID=3346969 RepID=UPI003665AC51
MRGRIALVVALRALADDAESMYDLVAHALPVLTTALVVPAAAVVGISTAVIELVHGIAVIKAFGQATRQASATAKPWTTTWSPSPAVNGPLLSLSSIAYVSVSPAVMLATSLGGGTLFVAADWVRPVDVLPFVLPGQAITAPLVVVTYAPQAFGQAGQAADRMVELLVTLPLAEPEQPFTAAGHRR